MCGRFRLSTDRDDLQSRFGFIKPGNILLSSRYNIAPSQNSPTVIVNNDQRECCEKVLNPKLNGRLAELNFRFVRKISNGVMIGR